MSGQIQVSDVEGLSRDSGQDADRLKAAEETSACCLNVGGGCRGERGQANLGILELIL